MDKAVIYITPGLKGLEIKPMPGGYIVVDGWSLTIINSSDKSLIGTKYAPPPPPPPSHSPSGGIPQPPLPIQLALWLSVQKGKYYGKIRFSHESIYTVLPAGIIVPATQQPEYKNQIWYIWAMTFGPTVSASVIVRHWVEGMIKEHDDPLYDSIVNFVYPLSAKISRERPHNFIIRNDSSSSQIGEVTVWFVETDIEGAELIDNLFKAQANHYLKSAGLATV